MTDISCFTYRNACNGWICFIFLEMAKNKCFKFFKRNAFYVEFILNASVHSNLKVLSYDTILEINTRNSLSSVINHWFNRYRWEAGMFFFFFLNGDLLEITMRVSLNMNPSNKIIKNETIKNVWNCKEREREMYNLDSTSLQMPSLFTV